MTTTWTQSTVNTDYDINGSFPSIQGEQATTASSVFIGEHVADVAFYLWYSAGGTPSGNVICGVWNSAGTLVHIYWTKAISSLPTSNSGLVGEGDSTTSYTISTGDSIGVTTDANTWVKIGASSTDVFDGTNSTRSLNGTSITSTDLAFKMTTGSAPPPSSSSLLFPPPVAFI